MLRFSDITSELMDASWKAHAMSMGNQDDATECLEVIRATDDSEARRCMVVRTMTDIFNTMQRDENPMHYAIALLLGGVRLGMNIQRDNAENVQELKRMLPADEMAKLRKEIQEKS